MSKLTERLDALRELIQSQGFLTGDGLSNEVNIRIFCKPLRIVRRASSKRHAS